jgi:hypothetical protein
MEISKERQRTRKNRGAFSVADDDSSEAPLIAQLRVDEVVLQKIIQRENLADIPVNDKIEISAENQKVSQTEFLRDFSEPGITPRPGDTPPISNIISEQLAGMLITSVKPVEAPLPASCNSPIKGREFTTKYEQSTSKVGANKEQSNSKVGAKYEQTTSKVVASHERSSSNELGKRYGEQTSSKLVAKYEQSDSEVTPNHQQSSSSASREVKQTASKVVAKPIAEVVANQEQTSSKLVANTSFAKLGGIQRNITVFMYQECKRLLSKVTSEISAADLSEIAKSDIGTAKNATIRLIEKCVIRRFEYKDGRSGWTRYELADNIYQEIRERELTGRFIDNREQSSSKVVAEPVAKVVANSSSSSSSSSYKELNTNTGTDSGSPLNESNNLPEDWRQIIWSEDTQKAGFGIGRLKQWWERKYCTAQEAQESIRHFEAQRKASPATHRINTSPINYLMGVMANSKYFSAPDGYLSPEDLAQQKKLDHQETVLRQRQRREEQYFELVFEEYFDGLSSKQIRELSPEFTDFQASRAMIRNKFFEKYWTEIHDSFKNNSGADVKSFTLDLIPPTDSDNRPDMKSFTPEAKPPAQPEEHPKLIAAGLTATYKNQALPEIEVLKRKINQLRQLQLSEPSTQTGESLRKYEQRLHDLESLRDPSTADEIRAHANEQFGPGA